MSFKLSKTLADGPGAAGVAPTLHEYEHRFEEATDRASAREEGANRKISDLYYNVVTDFYEYGWGQSFHFAPRVPGESFKESLARHERFLAQTLELGPGMAVADLGCGVGGPLMEIARFSGTKIVGVNSNGYQLERAQKLVEEAGLAHRAEFLNCDFSNVEAPDESFDAIYSIEATCHAPDKRSVYGEVFRLLKPGACFANYEYCMTDRYDADNPDHLQIKADIQSGGGLLEIVDQPTVEDALTSVGFEVLELRDLALQDGPSIPWYQPLVGSGLSLAGFRRSRIGRWVTQNTLKVLEALRVAPEGAVQVAEALNLCAAAMADAGRLGIFTPMYFIHARKPE